MIIFLPPRGRAGLGCGMAKNTEIAKKLRQNMTDAEKLLWYHLKNKQLNGYKFRRQEPIGDYIVDFVCYSCHIVIEADGGQHLDSEKDKERDNWLNSQGFRVLRFWNNDIISNIEGILEVIHTACSSPDPSCPLCISPEIGEISQKGEEPYPD